MKLFLVPFEISANCFLIKPLKARRTGSRKAHRSSLFGSSCAKWHYGLTLRPIGKMEGEPPAKEDVSPATAVLLGALAPGVNVRLPIPQSARERGSLASESPVPGSCSRKVTFFPSFLVSVDFRVRHGTR